MKNLGASRSAGGNTAETETRREKGKEHGSVITTSPDMNGSLCPPLLAPANAP